MKKENVVVTLLVCCLALPYALQVGANSINSSSAGAFPASSHLESMVPNTTTMDSLPNSSTVSDTMSLASNTSVILFTSTPEPDDGSGSGTSQLGPFGSSVEKQTSSASPNMTTTYAMTSALSITTTATTTPSLTLPPSTTMPTDISPSTYSSSQPTSSSTTGSTSTYDPTTDVSTVPSSGSSAILGVVIGYVMLIFLVLLFVAAVFITCCCYVRKKSKSKMFSHSKDIMSGADNCQTGIEDLNIELAQNACYGDKADVVNMMVNSSSSIIQGIKDTEPYYEDIDQCLAK